ncbi:ABC transporter permease [Sorangium sp. So ce426]|uniref:ABC transporter permease n=1 Tax=unclassified Sorangium TaxID=2621164 RepID=UPI003F5BAEB3
MNRLLSTILWDLKLQARYNIVAVACVVTALYILLFRALPAAGTEEILVLLLYTDPSMLGFMFIGALVLFEKDANILRAITVTPLRRWQYLWSKAISLTLIAVPASVVMALAAGGAVANWGFLILAIVLSSLLFVMLGFTGVARVTTFNQYIIVVPLFLAPLCLPLLGLFGVMDAFWFYIIPSQASLILFEAAFRAVSPAKLAYAALYLALWIGIAYAAAARSFEVHIIRGGKGA